MKIANSVGVFIIVLFIATYSPTDHSLEYVTAVSTKILENSHLNPELVLYYILVQLEEYDLNFFGI